MAANAGTIVVELQALLSEFQSQLDGVGQDLRKMGARLQEVGTAFTAAFTLPIVAAAGASAKFAADFSERMTKLTTIAGVAQAQMEEFRSEILALAPAVGIGPAELADALLVITSFGQRGANATRILGQAAKLAAVGLGETKDVARALVSVVNAYGEANLSAARAADVLLQTVIEGGAEANELAPALGRVVSIAATLGVQFEEVGAFLATFTRQGVSGEEAVTALRGALGTLLAPSAQAAEVLARAGTSGAELRKKLRDEGLLATLNEMIRLTGGNTEALDALIPNVRALAGILGTAGTQGAAYAQVLRNIVTSQGAVNAAFLKIKDDPAFKFRRFKAEAAKLAITVGDALMPSLLRLLSGLRTVVGWLQTAAEWFGRLPEPVRMGVVALAAMLAVVGPLLIVMGLLVKAWAAAKVAALLLATATKGVGIVLGAISPIVLLIGAALVSLGLATRAVVKHWDFVKHQAFALWTAIRDAFFTGVEAILGILAKIPLVGDKFEQARQAVVAAHEGMLAEAGGKLAELERAWNDAEVAMESAGGGAASFGGDVRAAMDEARKAVADLMAGAEPPTKRLQDAMDEFARSMAGVDKQAALLGPSFDRTRAEASALEQAIAAFAEAGAKANTVVGPHGETLAQLVERYRALNIQVGISETQMRLATDAVRMRDEILRANLTNTQLYTEALAEVDELERANLLTVEEAIRARQRLGVEFGKLIDISQAMRDAVSEAFFELGEAIGNSLAGADQGLRSIGARIVNVLGGLLVTVGRALIAFGTAGIAIKAFSINPFLALAAGAALVALGTALSRSVTAAVDRASHAMAAGAGGAGAAAAPPPPSSAVGQGAPQTQIILEFQDPSNPAVVQRILASVNRIHSRDATPVVSVPLAVIGSSGR
jgi:TP901 family phage tail tape measure protein